ncbi:hypothetical protein HPULCUR_006173 [Helicostylum pulchrum]|uniref:Uncharacterized protein n=1 Tax=Helicostylum pulchrum TaxID=562976 RepID=A0ABP9Y358_9FUNG
MISRLQSAQEDEFRKSCLLGKDARRQNPAYLFSYFKVSEPSTETECFLGGGSGLLSNQFNGADTVSNNE